MKLKVFQKEEQKEQEVKLMLVQEGDRVVLATVDEYGNRDWNLLTISPDGVRVCCGVPKKLGFKMSGSSLFVGPPLE